MAWTFLLAVCLLCCACNAREFVHLLPDGPAGVVWVVQLSDLHISSYYTNRSDSLKQLVGPLLALINPALVLITGDLTDGKTRDRSTMRQDEAEWVQYREAIETVITQSGLPPHVFFDMRGNHDKFGVPEVGGHLDYFSKYSISAQQNRTDTIQSVTVLNGSWKHLFVGIDDSMDIGLRGPSNLFGHAKDRRLEMLDMELSQWDGIQTDNVTKIVYGHFPTSFIASSEKGNRPENTFAKHHVSAYLCGHLHCKFGRKLFKHHRHRFSGKPGEFWEWGMGDWKENRMMRILAIDEGHTSFMDLDLHLSASTGQNLQTFVLATYPLDSHKMQRMKPLSPVQDAVKALVFSHQPIISVKARIYDSVVEPLIPMKELEMQRSSEANDRAKYFVTAWNLSEFVDPSPTRYLLQIAVVDALGKETVSELRPFSVKGKMAKLKWTWMELFAMGIVWDAFYQPLLWLALCSLLILLIIPKLYYLYLVREGNYKNLEFSLFRRNSMSTFWVIQDVFRVLQSFADLNIWWMQLFLVLYLIFLPWFWGQVLADGYPTGYMSIWGWTVEIEGGSGLRSGLGVPDVMVVVLPYVYQVIVPLFVLLVALSAERSLVQHHASNIISTVMQKEQNTAKPVTLGRHIDGALKKGSITTDDKERELKNQGDLRIPKVLDNKHHLSCKLCKRWIRKALLLACLGVTWIHVQQIRAIVGAYGFMAFFFSPGFAWPVPILLVAGVLQTSSVNT